MRIGGQPIVDRYMSGPAHNYPGSFSEVWDNSSIASTHWYDGICQIRPPPRRFLKERAHAQL